MGRVLAMTVTYVPRLFGGTLILGGSPVTTYTGIGPARPWFFPWSLLSNTLVVGAIDVKRAPLEKRR
jgi:hypothetical protein